MNNKILLTTVILIAIIVGGFYFSKKDKSTGIDNTKEVVSNNGFGVGQKAIVYKSPTCGCCVGYAAALRKQGVSVEVVETDDMSLIKDKYGIPANKQSCHTIAMGNYFIEGHVPMEAAEKLLKENPDIDGIGLPRMPSGTPGMPGPKRAPYEVYQMKNGEFSSFVII